MELCLAGGAGGSAGGGGAGAGAGAGAASGRLPGRLSAKIRSTSLLAVEPGSAAEAADTRPTGAMMPTKQAVKTRLKMNLQVEETATNSFLPFRGCSKERPPKIRFEEARQLQGISPRRLCAGGYRMAFRLVSGLETVTLTRGRIFTILRRP